MIHYYTALMGDCKDRLRPLPAGMEGVAFMDARQLARHQANEFKTDGWNTIQVLEDFGDPVRAIRRMKMRPDQWLDMKENDISVWLDASFEVTGSLRPLRKLLDGEHDMVTLKHPFHRDLSEEVQALLRKHMTRDQAVGLFDRYLDDGYQYLEYPQVIGGILIRYNNEKIRRFGRIWAEEYARGCDRDQVCLGYSIWKADLTVCMSNINYSKDHGHGHGFRFHKA